MIGQSQVTEPLMTALRGDRVGHAYLFSGPRGCGKTTSARILARCLNCAQGPTDTPCGTCDSCVELGRGGGGSLDVVEIDAATHNGVDDARDLRERAVFAPARDRFKIFILDEAHMVTPQGFNALLKLVEEPPDHVKFIFATTEPEKVIGTIRSRTHHYPFRLVPPAAMLEYVEKLCETEGVSVEPGVLPLVVRAGGGSPRDTLSLLDQLIAGSESRARRTTSPCATQRAVSLLGYTHAELLDEVVDAFAAQDRRGRVRRGRPRRADRPGSAPLRRRPARAPARPHRRRRDRPGRGGGAARRVGRRPRAHDAAGRRVRRGAPVAHRRPRDRDARRHDRRDLAATAARAHGRPRARARQRIGGGRCRAPRSLHRLRRRRAGGRVADTCGESRRLPRRPAAPNPCAAVTVTPCRPTRRARRSTRPSPPADDASAPVRGADRPGHRRSSMRDAWPEVLGRLERHQPLVVADRLARPTSVALDGRRAHPGVPEPERRREVQAALGRRRVRAKTCARRSWPCSASA